MMAQMRKKISSTMDYLRLKNIFSTTNIHEQRGILTYVAMAGVPLVRLSMVMDIPQLRNILPLKADRSHLQARL